MGFDLNGENPTSDKGEYFRNNVWWWKRLSCFIIDNVKVKKPDKWFFNDGHLVNKKECDKIVKFLEKALANKLEYKEWIERSEKDFTKKDFNEGKCAYPFEWNNVKEFKEFVEASGGFRIY
jgi:hypothetical protein